MAHPMLADGIWLDKWRCDEAEKQYQLLKAGVVSVACPNASVKSSLVTEIAKAREQIKKSLHSDAACVTDTSRVVPADNTLVCRVESLEAENKDLRKVTQVLQAVVQKLETRISALEKQATGATTPQEKEVAVIKPDTDEDADDFELFGSDEEEDADADKIREERLKMYADKKKDKKVVIAKSSIVLDVKPWDDETDMAALEKTVRGIKQDGLLWGASKLVPVGYGIKKLQISCVVEDDKVSIEELEEQICDFEDFVQSTDIAAFNKI